MYDDRTLTVVLSDDEVITHTLTMSDEDEYVVVVDELASKDSQFRNRESMLITKKKWEEIGRFMGWIWDKN